MRKVLVLVLAACVSSAFASNHDVDISKNQQFTIRASLDTIPSPGFLVTTASAVRIATISAYSRAPPGSPNPKGDISSLAVNIRAPPDI